MPCTSARTFGSTVRPAAAHGGITPGRAPTIFTDPDSASTQFGGRLTGTGAAVAYSTVEGLDAGQYDFLCYNLWQPIDHEVVQNPLALLDASRCAILRLI